ncbi:hypothetical protein N7495_005554 [Penicillium taxi]|uniref:uncharacterized protein n=1 Tax=Penicillium taxi TaxID=168475 RepID=UPI0025459358|nr:uncharacterized protein N7495_005554 [Penicillium taxi]KAJ5893863.1 hypothetical protein N7495_005554 [Penicillium taxi]
MNLPDSRVSRSASVASDAERERLRELSKYYGAFGRARSSSLASFRDNERRSIPENDDPQHQDEQLSIGTLSEDITLTALAQLGIYRLSCNRSFVSIIDGDRRLIIAEATGSVPTSQADQHTINDDIYTIALFTGQDLAHEMDTPNITANQTRYIIRDCTQEDCFKGRSFVRGTQFYAEVPLYGVSGYVIGSYCVVDEKPHAGFSEVDFANLQEVANAIAQHLENVRMIHYHRRGERLVTGLMNFVKDSADFDPREVSSDHRLASTTKASNSEVPPSPAFPDSSVPSSGFSASSLPYGSPSIYSTTPGDEHSLDEVLRPTTANHSLSSNTSQASFTEAIPIADRISNIFSRASILLRKSMDLDGVVFLDAARSNSSFLSAENQPGWEPLPRTVVSEFPSAPRPTPMGREDWESDQSDVSCDILGLALKGNTDNVLHQSQEQITQGLLDMLVTYFPQGQIFRLAETLDEGYISHSSQTVSIESVSLQLKRMLPGAKSVLFLPLWDYHKSRWMAGTLVWTHDHHRDLGIEELHYFKIFCDSIVSEVSRVHWITIETSKFDFISSVSHELRSPLHGILASAELLHAGPLEPGQEEMVRMIETSGLTLLDTTDHLLDFCKINNLSQRKKLKKKYNSSDTSSLISDFDLGHLVEETTNILYTGQRPPTPVISPLNENLLSVDGTRPVNSRNKADEMSVVVRIEQLESWKILSEAGAWRRIVMNLLGNAIKWTKTGFVEISLSKAVNPAEPNGLLAHLSVTDTGRGISRSFLRHKLFSPFTQEDSLAEGVGLGLSIVRQVVESLGGHINVRSELKVGTQVDVYIPVQASNGHRPHTSLHDHIPTCSRDTPTNLQACIVAFNGYPDLKETPTGMLTAEAKRKLSIQSTIADVIMSRFGWSVSLVESLDNAEGDVAVIDEAMLMNATGGSRSLENLTSQQGPKLFLILSSKTPFLETGPLPNVVRVSQPFGPYKIQKAVQKLLKTKDMQLHSVSNPALLLTPSGSHDRPISSLCNAENDLLSSVANETYEVAPVTSMSETNLRHVLVVDDNEINIKILTTFLRKIGCSFDTATNGLIALQQYQASEKPYDFVLMDVSMPVMDGLESTRKIRQYEHERGLNPSCIMAVSGVASDTMQQQAVQAGVNDYLCKPLSLQKLKKIMNFSRPQLHRGN